MSRAPRKRSHSGLRAQAQCGEAILVNGSSVDAQPRHVRAYHGLLDPAYPHHLQLRGLVAMTYRACSIGPGSGCPSVSHGPIRTCNPTPHHHRYPGLSRRILKFGWARPPCGRERIRTGRKTAHLRHARHHRAPGSQSCEDRPSSLRRRRRVPPVDAAQELLLFLDSPYDPLVPPLIGRAGEGNMHSVSAGVPAGSEPNKPDRHNADDRRQGKMDREKGSVQVKGCAVRSPTRRSA